jgi:phage repressor protein C with HTH and peptisase S24 domain
LIQPFEQALTIDATGSAHAALPPINGGLRSPDLTRYRTLRKLPAFAFTKELFRDVCHARIDTNVLIRVSTPSYQKSALKSLMQEDFAKMTVGERLRLARIDAGLRSASAAAARFRWVVSTYISHENGNREPGRQILEYAKAFRVNHEWLLTGHGPKESRNAGSSEVITTRNDPRINLTEVPSLNHSTFVVVGTVEAGKFYSMDDQNDAAGPPETVTWTRDRRFPNAAHVAFKVRGDSMDLQRIFDGDTILAVDWNDTGMAPITGLTVVVERKLFGGHALELTVKKLEVKPDSYVLHPRSSNPAHQPIIVPRRESEDGDPEFRIVALVIGRYSEQDLFQWP